MLIIPICLLMDKIYLNLEPTIEILNSNSIFLISISSGFRNAEYREVRLNGNMYDFFEENIAIGKSNISNIHKYLKTKNSMK